MSFGSIDLAITGDTKGLEKNVEKNLGSSFKKLAGIASVAFAGAFAGGKFIDTIKRGVLGASDLTESINAVNVSLGTGADSFLKFGQSAATNLGLTQAALNQAIVPAAAILRNAGLAGDVLSGKLQTLATRATDVGSVFNATTTEVLESFNAALRGENDPIQRFGVMLNEASIGAKAVEMGLASSTKQVSAAAKAQAAYGLILQQTDIYSGDFVGTSDGLANSMKILKANASELRDELGAKLVPAATAVTGWLRDMVVEAREGEGPLSALGAAARGVGDYFQAVFGPSITGLKESFTAAAPGLRDLGSVIMEMGVTLMPTLTAAIQFGVEVVGYMVTALGKLGTFLADHDGLVTALAASIAGLGAGMLAFQIVVKAQAAWMAIAAVATGGWTAAFWALNAALYANPVGLVVAAVVALGVAFSVAWSKSETFREITVKAFNAIKDAVVTAMSLAFQAFTFWIKGILSGISGLAGAWSKLPSILGGGDDGWASKVQSAANGIIDGINAVQNSINSLKGKDIRLGINVVVNRVEQFNETPGAMGAGIFGPGTGGSIATTPNGTSAMEEFYKDQAKNTFIALDESIAKIGSNIAGGGTGGGGSSGGGGGNKAADDAAKKAAEAAKKAAKKAAEAARKAAQKVRDSADKAVDKQLSARKFVDMVTGTPEQINTQFDKLLEKVAIGNKPKLTKLVKEFRSDMLALGKARDKVSGKLDTARDALADLKSEQMAYSKSVRDAIVDTGNVANNNTKTFTGVRNSMRAALRQATAFRDAIVRLTAAGLNKNNLQQIIAAGPEAGLAAAKAIQQGGQAGIAELNGLNSQLEAVGKDLGTSTANTFYAAGVSAAQGLVNGLKSQEDALNKQMDALALRMVSTLKKQLGIKSPSRVMADLMRNGVGAGMIRGLNQSRQGVASASRGLGASVVFGAGSVLVNGVSDPNAARTSGMLVGSAAADSIARSRELQALAGMA